MAKTSCKKRENRFDANDLFISVITIGEISKGITLLPASKRKAELINWAIAIENNYADRVLNINCKTTHIWGELTANAQMRGKMISAADGIIAASALANGLHVMTGNTADFEPTGVLLLNPWDDQI